MGRRKVQMKKIEDKASRQVTFSKRRGGLMKKARELSILCDVEVALITISANGRVYDLCSGNCLRKVLERYHIHVDARDDVSGADDEANKHYGADCRDPWTSADLLQVVQRQFEEKNLNQLNIVELMQLEQQMDMTLGQTRFRKTQLMMETLTALHDQEKELREEKQFMEKEIAAMNEDIHHLHEQDLVKELELNNRGDGNAQPPKQVMFRLL